MFGGYGKICLEIGKISSYCLNFSDIKPFYLKALSYINKIPAHEQHSSENLADSLSQKLQEPFSEPSLLMTERYFQELQTFKSSFCASMRDVREFQYNTFMAFKEFFKVLLNDAFMLLGPAPCGYDIRAMGSIGREVIAPDSHLQCFLLIEEEAKRPYFKKLMTILELQIASLGETKFDAYEFTCLKKTPSNGLQIDSLSLLLDDVLINTPEGMADIQNCYPTEELNCIANHILQNISIAKSTDKLYIDYCKQIKSKLSLPEQQERAFARMQAQKSTFLNNLGENGCANNIAQSSHKVHYKEALDLLLADLGIYFNLIETNALDIIQALVKVNVFTAESGKLLYEGVSWLYTQYMHLQVQEKESDTNMLDNPQKNISGDQLEEKYNSLR